MVFSAKHRHKLKGTELAHSITTNPHKMLNVPATCSFLLVEDLRTLHRANGMPAEYLFHEQENEDMFWDLGDLRLQCGRRGDSLKLALAWTFFGTSGFEEAINHAFDVALYMANLVKEHRDMLIVSRYPPPCLQVCFYYAPRGQLAESNDENSRRTRRISDMLMCEGYMVDYSLGQHGQFLRVVINTQTSRSTVDDLLQTIIAVAEN